MIPVSDAHDVRVDAGKVGPTLFVVHCHAGIRAFEDRHLAGTSPASRTLFAQTRAVLLIGRAAGQRLQLEVVVVLFVVRRNEFDFAAGDVSNGY
jgi:hypothetical protein